MECKEHGRYTGDVEGEGEDEADDELSAGIGGEGCAGCRLKGWCWKMLFIVSACDGDLARRVFFHKQAFWITVKHGLEVR